MADMDAERTWAEAYESVAEQAERLEIDLVHPSGRNKTIDQLTEEVNEVLPPDMTAEEYLAGHVCSRCGTDLVWEPSVGWVDDVSGDYGGTYDHCPESMFGHKAEPKTED